MTCEKRLQKGLALLLVKSFKHFLPSQLLMQETHSLTGQPELPGMVVR